MNSSERSRRQLLAIFVAAQCLVVLAAGPSDESRRVSGGGGFALSSSVTSMWGAVDETAPPGKKLLSFAIYFRGTTGWHDRKWESDLQFDADPFSIEFRSDLTALRAEVDRTTRTLTVLGRQIDLGNGNVILVDHVDRPGEEVVSILGEFDLSTPEDANPALWLLQQNQELMSRVLGPEVVARDRPLPVLPDILTGTWGWEVEGASCDDNPHTLTFSDDGKTLTLRYARSLDENPPTTVVYTVVGDGDGYLRTKKVAETETAEDGQVVTWDLVVLDVNSYCWHRTDWQPGRCTRPARRCGVPRTNR